MPSLLTKVAAHLLKNYESDLSTLCIVLPNKRASIALKKELAKNSKKTFFAPSILSIEDFVFALSKYTQAEAFELQLIFYSVYQQHLKSEAQSFDKFTTWAPILLNDFNDLDRYLVNANSLFSSLKNIKEIESWSLNEDVLSDLQKNYLLFWDSLGNYYRTLKKELEKRNIAYQGMAYRKVAEEISALVATLQWQKYIFVGFNALTKAEERIIDSLMALNKCDTFWDADSFYLNNHAHEAGYFLRKQKAHQEKLKKDFQWVHSCFLEEQKTITITQVAKNIGQVRAAGEIALDIKRKNPLSKIAIVLADENLLVPLLHNMPEDIGNVNVTMGYPLKNSPIALFVSLIIELLETKTTANENTFFKTKSLFSLLQHNYSNYFFEEEKQAKDVLIDLITGQESALISLTKITSLLKQINANGNNYFLRLLTSTSILNTLYPFLNHVKSSLQDADEEKTFIIYYLEILEQLALAEKNYFPLLEFKTQKNALLQLVSGKKVPFEKSTEQDEIQIMGMLETRCLDFDAVILLSANEGILPENAKQHSFIPHDIRIHQQLPTYSDKDAIYAYHFYRLLQQSKTTFISYNTEIDGLGKGEKSRFITQLLYEIPKENNKVQIHQAVYSTPITKTTIDYSIRIIKTPEIREKIAALFTSGLSPSLLNTYKNCSLQFYYQYIVGLKEKKDAEEEITANIFGNILHKTLLRLYQPYKNTVLNNQAYVAMIKKLEAELQGSILEEFKSNEVKQGKNLLIVKMAEKALQRFLKKEQEYNQKNEEEKTYLTITSLEEEWHVDIRFKEKQIRLKGKIDRVERLGNTIRITDYKTGFVQDSDLRLKSIDDVFTDNNKSKAFQLLYYALLYTKSTPLTNNSTALQCGITSFRKIHSGFNALEIEGENTVSTGILKRFESGLMALIEEIDNTDIPFSQTTEEDNCIYCSFKSICNR